MKTKPKKELFAEIERLRQRVEETEEELRVVHQLHDEMTPLQHLARAMLDQAAEVILLCDEKGVVIQASQAAYRYFSSNLLQTPFDDSCGLTLTSPLPSHSNSFSITSVLEGQIFRALEVTYKRDDNKVFHFIMSARPLLYNQEKVQGCVVMLTDITERRAMEEEISHLASFPQLNPNPIVEIDLSGNIHYVNPTAERLLPDLRSTGVKHPWFGDYESLAAMSQTGQMTSSSREIEINDAFYQQTIHYTPEWNRLRIHGLDITERKRAEGALRESETRMNRTQEIAHLGSWELDLVHNRLTWSDEVYRIFGLQPQEFGATYEAFLERVHPEDRAAVDAAYSGSLRENRNTYEIEHRVVRKDTNDTRVVHEKCEHFRDVTGKIIRSIGMVHDITERKRMEEELRRSRDELETKVQERTAALVRANELLERMFSSIGIMIAYMDKNFNFVRVNRAYAVADEKEPDFYVGKNHFALFPNEENEAIFKKVVETGEPCFYFAKPFEYAEHPERGVTYWDWSLQPVKDPDGSVSGVVLSLLNVTERIRAEEEKRQSEKILEAFFTSTITPLVFLDRHFNFIRVNEAYAKACQRDVSEFHGKNHFELYPSDAKGIFEKVVKTKTPYQTIARPFVFPDHPEWETTYWNWTLNPLLDTKGEVEFLVFALQDVTDRERAVQKTREQAALLDLAHDSIFVRNFDEVITFWNRGAEEMYGWTKEEALGKKVHTLLQTRFPEPFEDIIIEITRRGRWEGDLVHTRKDGKSLVVSSRWALQRNKEGIPVNTLEIDTDITKRKEAEEVQARLIRILEATSDFVGIADTDGQINYLNTAARRMLGIDKNEDISKMSLNEIHPDWADTIILREGIPTSMREGIWSGETAFRSRAGREIPVSQLIISHKSSEGKVQFLSTVARDITERKEEERRIYFRDSLLEFFAKKTSRKEYLDVVINLICEWSGSRCGGIRVLDHQGNIPYESYIGFSREFWELENFLAVQRDQCVCVRVIKGELDPQDIPVVTQRGSFCCGNMLRFIEALADEQKSRYRATCIRNGFLSVAIIPIHFHEEMVGAIHLADEKEGRLTFEKVEFIESMAPLIGEAVNRFNLEEKLRESENRLRLLSSRLLTVQEQERKRVAHELHDGIGQMLTAVKFKVEDTLHQMAKSKSRSKKALETIIPVIRQSVEEVRRIQMDLRPSLLDDIGILATIGWFTREFQKVYTSIRIEKRIDLQEERVPDSLKVVIFRVIQEALNNIAKHSGANIASLSLKTLDGNLELAIGDNGQGFDLERVRSIDSSEKGFGLSSMRERTELSGGMFSIVSTIGAGTTIKATWPI